MLICYTASSTFTDNFSIRKIPKKICNYLSLNPYPSNQQSPTGIKQKKVAIREKNELISSA